MNLLRWMVAASALLMIACAGETNRRGPVQKPEFDPAQFLTAEARGPSEGEAKRQAMAALAAIFEARVQAESESRAQSIATELTADGDRADEVFEKQVRQMVRVDTDVQLEGLRIGWAGPQAEGDYLAVAVLDRRQAAQRWRNQWHRLRMDLDTRRQALETKHGRLPRLAALNHMTALMARMAVVESRLSVLGRPVAPAEMDDAALLAQRARLMAQLAFYIEMTGEPAEAFAHRLAAQLNTEGYVLVNTLDQAAGRISGRVWIEPLDLKNPDIRFYRALAEIAVLDLDTGLQVAAFSENVRKGHVDENEARRLAVDLLAELTAKKIVAALAVAGEN